MDRVHGAGNTVGAGRPAWIARRGVRVHRIAALAAWAVLAGSALATNLRPSLASVEPGRPGVALREALAAEARGDLVVAEAGLAAVGRAHPIVADHAELLRVRVLLAAGRARDAASVAESALAAHRASPLIGRLLEQLGEAQRVLGDEAAARDAWTHALAASGDAERRASLLVALASSFERDGRGREARGRWLELWRDLPASPEAAQAGAALDRLEAPPGALRRSAADHLERGEALYRALHNEAALASFDRALALGLNERGTAQALERRAHTLFRLRRYPEAATAFDRVDEPAAAIEHARAVARAGDVAAAVQELEDLTRTLGGGQAERARYVAAILLEDEEPADRAHAHFTALAADARDPAIRRDARWRLAWGAYRSGRFEEALVELDRLEPLDAEGAARAQVRFWRARALEKRGDPRARDGFAALAAELPLTYYGWRAGARLGADAGASADGPAPTDGVRRLQPRELERVRILVEAGLLDEAKAELELLARTGLALGDRLDLAGLASDAGDLHRAQRLVADAYPEDLAKGPRPGLEELWWMAWPWAYPDAARDGGVPPELVRAVMREESGYRPEVISVVGARGLLQIMPDTGERLARDLGLAPFAPDDLFDPRVNLRLGTHYLGELSAQFGGRLSAAVGSYNAGPNAVARWIAARGSLEDDEWVESIPYEQTRTYVKRVLRSLRAYEILY
ncbi:MAG TPA: transglycosylase SLT domain-containing protein [Myxococcota bacterium]|nr:transglycosylase SLT domain-containing protein [Myxococcota bacterium]